MSCGAGPPIRALLIGIDRYLPPRDPRTPRYGQLHGCVRDVERMARWLHRGLAVPAERIHRLLAPQGAGPPPPDRRREWPGYEGLVAAFERLIDEALPGEHLWIHYSGHGGRVPTLVPESKGPRGLDECLVPWDVGDPEARYLRDVELAVLLERMECAGLFVTVVLDCCHSGGATRRATRVRGVDAVDRTPRPEESLVASARRLAEARRCPAAGWRHAELPAGRAFDPTGYVLLAACRPGERTVEERCDDGDPGGAFTRSLLRALDGMERGATYSQLFVAAGEDVRSRFPAQTPVIEGEAERPLLGGREVPRQRGVAVLGEGRTTGTFRIATGQVHGIAPGAHFAIEPPAAEAGTGAVPRPVVEVTRAGAVVSEVRRIETGVEAANGTDGGDRAVLRPELNCGREHLVRWHRLERLENREPGAFLRGRLRVTLKRLPRGWQPGEAVDGEAIDSEDGIPEVEIGGWVLLRIVNRAPDELNVAVLDLRPDRSVAQVFPAWRGGWFQPFDSGSELRIPLRAWLPEGMSSGTDVLLVMATTGPVSHRWLEMPPLEQPGGGEIPTAGDVETERVKVPDGREGSGPEDTAPLDDGPDGWITARRVVELVRRGDSPSHGPGGSR